MLLQVVQYQFVVKGNLTSSFSKLTHKKTTYRQKHSVAKSVSNQNSD